MAPAYVVLQTAVLHLYLISGTQRGLQAACSFSMNDWLSPIGNVWYQPYGPPSALRFSSLLSPHRHHLLRIPAVVFCRNTFWAALALADLLPRCFCEQCLSLVSKHLAAPLWAAPFLTSSCHWGVLHPPPSLHQGKLPLQTAASSCASPPSSHSLGLPTKALCMTRSSGWQACSSLGFSSSSGFASTADPCHCNCFGCADPGDSLVFSYKRHAVFIIPSFVLS